MKLKEIVKKCLMGKKYSSETYVKYLRSIGMKIGNDVTIYVPSKTLIDEQYPWMITICNNVQITEGVKIIAHDYSWSVLKKYPPSVGTILGASGKVIIGDNVFIGMNSIICRNVVIGNNVIIGTGSVVTKNCEENGIYAGNPACKIMDIDDFYKKRSALQIREAKELARTYYERFGKKPERDVFHEYFMLFETEDTYATTMIFRDKIKLCSNERDSIEYMKNHPPFFKSYDEFMRYCFDE